jgi:hypothetical protein
LISARFLKYARLRVRAVQNRHIAPCAAAALPVADALHDEVRLVALVEGGVEVNLFALRAARPKILAEPARIVRDERVGRFEDRAGGAVVLLQAIQIGLRKVTAEMLQVLNLCAAPAINRLIVIADGERITLRAHQELHPAVLDRIRVLELIDQDVTEAALIVRKELGLIAPQLECAQQQLRKIDDPGLRAGGLVACVEFDELAAVQIARILKMGGAAAFVLVRVDEPLDLAWHPAALIKVPRLQNLADEAHLVLGVQDLKALRQMGFAPVHP